MVGTILAAQWRILRNHRPRSGVAGRTFTVLVWLVWYGLWAVAAFAGALIAREASPQGLAGGLPWALLGVTLYWQITPVLTANLGASLDLKKLLIYPVTDSQLFAIDVLLRATTAGEMLLVTVGVTAGLMSNPAVPRWAPPAGALLFVTFNLLLAAGLRSLMERLMGVRRLREVLILGFMLCAAIPQLIAVTGVPIPLRRFLSGWQAAVLPWSAAARLALARRPAVVALLLLLWIAAAFVFARRQFRKSLAVDAAAAVATNGNRRAGRTWTDRFYRLPSLLFPDPFAVLLEKELRTLARSPRFRILFLMGCTFGMVVWLPVSSTSGRVDENYPLFVSFYAAILMAEVIIWNQFGFDRGAVQVYFSMPAGIGVVLRAKNTAAVAAILADISVVLLVCLLLRIHLAGAKVLEAYAVTLVACLYCLAAGNLTSFYQARPMDPEHAWGRGSGSRFQWQVLLGFPVLIAPVALAYLARYAFDSTWAFYAVLAFDALAGGVVYSIATESAIHLAESRKEDFLALMSRAGGPIVLE